MILLAQVLQCFTISGNVSAIMAYIRQNAGVSYKTTAIAMYTTLAMGVFIFGSIQLGKWMYITLEISGFYGMAVVSLVGALVAFTIIVYKIYTQERLPGGNA